MYQRGQIYCIRSYQTNDVYIGSTCNILYKRMGGHRKDYKMYLNGKFSYVSSFEILKYDDAYIELVEDYPCESKSQLHKREGEVIRATENCVNKRIEGRSKKEYHQDNREKKLEQFKEYYQTHKEKLSENKKEKVTCECGSTVRKSDIRQHERTKKHQTYLENL